MEHDYIVQESRGFRIRAADELIDALDKLLRSENLSRVDSTVDPDYGFALSRESPRLVLG